MKVRVETREKSVLVTVQDFEKIAGGTFTPKEGTTIEFSQSTGAGWVALIPKQYDTYHVRETSGIPELNLFKTNQEAVTKAKKLIASIWQMRVLLEQKPAPVGIFGDDAPLVDVGVQRTVPRFLLANDGKGVIWFWPDGRTAEQCEYDVDRASRLEVIESPRMYTPPVQYTDDVTIQINLEHARVGTDDGIIHFDPKNEKEG